MPIKQQFNKVQITGVNKSYYTAVNNEENTNGIYGLKDNELRKQTAKFRTKPFTKKINIAITELQAPDFGLVPK